MAGGRGDGGLYDGHNVLGARMWLEVGAAEESMVEEMYKEPGCGWRLEQLSTVWWIQCIKIKGVAGDRKDRGLYDGRIVPGARMWLEVGGTEDNMVDAMYKEQGCGLR